VSSDKRGIAETTPDKYKEYSWSYIIKERNINE
jgi:hypothetical protein